MSTNGSSNRNVLPATEYPRPRGPLLTAADLKPADVLLSRGDTEIANLIVAADRGSFSHAALWTGSTIIEATMKGGVEEHEAKGLRYVYRYRNPRAKTPEAESLSPGQVDAVIAEAREQVGNVYSTSEIHLLGVVFQKWWPFGRPRRSLTGSLLEALGGPMARTLREWLQASYARSAPRICSELVALAFFQGRVPLYTISPAQRPAAPAEEVPKLRALTAPASEEKALESDASSQDLQQLEANVSKAFKDTESAAAPATRGIAIGDVALDFETGERLGVVTPGDLQFSPSLYFVGIFDAG